MTVRFGCSMGIRIDGPIKGFSVLFRDFQLAEIAFFFNSKLKTKNSKPPEPGFRSGTN